MLSPIPNEEPMNRKKKPRAKNLSEFIKSPPKGNVSAARKLSAAAQVEVSTVLNPLFQARKIIDDAIARAGNGVGAIDGIRPGSGWQLHLASMSWVKPG